MKYMAAPQARIPIAKRGNAVIFFIHKGIINYRWSQKIIGKGPRYFSL
jgi:hypothetical protein